MVQKSHDFLGGNFSCAFQPNEVIITQNVPEVISQTEGETISEDGKTLEVYHIKTQSNRVILMRGDLWHVPGKIQNSCHGCRDSVVVQVPRAS